MTEYYATQLAASQLFQDMVMEKFAEGGFTLSFYSSREFQYRKGESRQGVEVKLDRRWPETKHLYIELKEKTHPDNERYQWSGIMRQDNTKLWVIGNEQKAWVISKKHLLAEFESRRHEVPIKTPTSIGFRIPIERADEICAWTIEFDRETQEAE